MSPAQVNIQWKELQHKLSEEFGGELPDLKVVLFLIGIQELGKGPLKYSKRQKEELMHIAVCKLLSYMGFYSLQGLDNDGWPHWQLVQKVPAYTTLEQEMLLKSLAVRYFQEVFSQ